MSEYRNTSNIREAALIYILFFSIVLFFTLIYTKISFSIPVDGDGALHAGTVDVMASTGKLLNFHPLTITDGNELLPVFYPKIFYVETTMLRQLIGTVVYFVVVPLFGIFIGIFSFLISRLIFKNSLVPLLTMLVTFISYGLVSNSVEMFRMETMVVLQSLAALYCLMKFSQDRNKGYFICSILLFASSIVIKQQAYIYAPLYLLILLTKINVKLIKRVTLILTFFLSAFLISLPVLINEFKATGTLFYPGVPLIGTVERQIANAFDIKLYSVGEGWEKYAIGSDRLSNLESHYSKLENHLRFLNPFDNDGVIIVYILLLIIGSLALIYKGYYYLVLFLVIQQILLFIFPLDRYFLLSQILSVIVAISSLEILTNKLSLLQFRPKLLFLTFIVLASIASGFQLFQESLTIPNYSWTTYVPGRLKADVDAGTWLKQNTPSDSVIITPRTNVVSYYSQRQALWLNQLGGMDIYEAFINNDIESIRRIAKTYEHSYIAIQDFWVIDKEADGKWISFVERETVNRLNANPRYFSPVYNNGLVSIFEVK